MGERELEILRQIVKEFEGKVLWEVRASEFTGSSFTLQIGGRLLSTHKPIHGPPLERGEFSAYVIAGWRIEDDQGIRWSWLDDRSNDGPMIAGLESLTNRTIRRAEVSRRGWDLSLEFEGGLRLVVFCDFTERSEWDFCYHVHSPLWDATVSKGGAIEISEANLHR